MTDLEKVLKEQEETFEETAEKVTTKRCLPRFHAMIFENYIRETNIMGILYVVDPICVGSYGYLVTNIDNRVKELKVTRVYTYDILNAPTDGNADCKRMHEYTLGEFIHDGLIHRVYFELTDSENVQLPAHELVSVS